MDLDLTIALAGLVVGFTVGLTGMGGGALMTPLLVLVFGIHPLAAVSSDLVASMVMKPVGGGVHLRHGTVHRGIVGWLVAGSVPAAFSGVLLLDALGDGAEPTIKALLGVALLVASAAMVVRSRMAARRGTASLRIEQIAVRRGATLAVGMAGGLIVGLTSVGSGSLMIVLLIALYPGLSTRAMIGTDLVQAVPLVASAALGHLMFGEVRLGLTAALLVGAIPGVYAGARVSSRADDRWIRPLLVTVLVASALKLLDAPTAFAAGAASAAGAVALIAARRPAPHPAPPPVPAVLATADAQGDAGGISGR